MHKLQNGSQVSVRPQRKPLVGLGGYFSESNDQGAPSYPGQDWFNDCTDEFLNALAEMGITYNPLRLDHLARMVNAFKEFGLGTQVGYQLSSQPKDKTGFYKFDSDPSAPFANGLGLRIARSSTGGDYIDLAFNRVGDGAAFRFVSSGSVSTWKYLNFDLIKATTAVAEAGTEDQSYMTSLKTVQSINKQFDNNSLLVNGYQVLPGGLILQWLLVPGEAGLRTAVFPIAFPNAFLRAVTSQASSSRTTPEAMVFRSATNTSITHYYSSNNSGIIFALGY
ncbi:hypothetical protein ACI8HA_003182 [Vibrio cholerae]